MGNKYLYHSCTDHKALRAAHLYGSHHSAQLDEIISVSHEDRLVILVLRYQRDLPRFFVLPESFDRRLAVDVGDDDV